jgi:ubiquitin-conjugating enzyme E2 variant
MPSKRPQVCSERATAGDLLSGILFLLLVTPLANRVAAAAAAVSWRTIPVVVGAAFVGILTCDLVSGLVHWACDTFFSENTPVIGRTLIEPFREHHRDPLAITRRTFLRVSSSNLLVVGCLLGLVSSWHVISAVPYSPFVDVWVASFACAAALTNQLHKWAHLSHVPWPIARLHATGAILTPAHHARHHAVESGGAFCITVGWLNPILDRIGLFSALERLLVGRSVFQPD